MKYEKHCRNCEHAYLKTCKGCETLGNNTFANFKLRSELQGIKDETIVENNKKFIAHRHLCEIKLFNDKHKDIWAKECQFKKRQNEAGYKDGCDDCEHLIIVTFLDNDTTKASEIIRPSERRERARYDK